MYSRHEEHSAPINASAERVFDQLDDQTRLTEHMSKRSWKMGWGKMETVLDRAAGTLGWVTHRPAWPSIRDSIVSG